MTLYTKEKPETIRRMFDEIAKNYERGNAILSFQTYRLWNKALVRAIYRDHHTHLLDLCAGTGDILLPYLRKRKSPCQATLLDFSPGMLEIAKEKAEKIEGHSIDFIQGDAHKIPLPSQSIDAITIAYGVRNLQNPLLCYQEAFRVLKPGGTLGILELTRPQFAPLRYCHGLYLKLAMPLLGKWITSNKEAYEYLCNSIHHFVAPSVVQKELEEAGFREVKITPLLGGIATLICTLKSLTTPSA